MHGVSEVIAIILILMITISIAGLAYTFMSSTMASTTSAASSAVDSTTSSMLTSFAIESVDANIIYIRNTGQNAISGLSVYVNDVSSRFNMTPSSIAIGGVGSIAINDFVKTGDLIKITTTNGFSTSKKAPDECYGAIACWRFDENVSLVAHDMSINSNDGTLTNGPVWTSGIFGGALQLDGSNDYVVTSNISILNQERSLTVAGWFKFSRHSSIHQSLFSDGSQSSPLGFIWIYRASGSDSLTLQYEDETTYRTDITSANNFLAGSDNSWVHIAVVADYANKIVKFYRNGAINSTITTTNTMIFPSISRPKFIGSYNSDIHRLNGTIDEVYIWSKAIDAQEVAKLYGKPRY